LNRRLTRPCAAIFGIVSLGALAGCSSHQLARCEPTDRYTTVGSVGPVRIPDDLTPPDESDALQLPPASAADSSAPPAGGCLEEPPKFASGNRTQAQPTAPASPAPAPSPEREISN
jgi:hypothetical protein